MAQKWLSNQENQQILYQLSTEAVTTLAPYEVYLLDEVFPAYVRLAQEGEVDTGEQLRREFAIAGADELLITCIVPALAMTLGLLLAVRGLQRISDLEGNGGNGNGGTGREQMSEALDRSLNEFCFTPGTQERLRETLLEVLWRSLFRQ